MTLFWLQVAAILYAAGSIAVFPTVLYKNERWRSICIHLAGMGFFFHFVSVVEMLFLAHRWMPVGMRETESLLGLLLAGLFKLFASVEFSYIAKHGALVIPREESHEEMAAETPAPRDAAAAVWRAQRGFAVDRDDGAAVNLPVFLHIVVLDCFDSHD